MLSYKLCLAAKYNIIKEAEKILETKDVDINAYWEGSNPLLYACENESLDVFNKLLENPNLNIEAVNNGGQNAFQILHNKRLTTCIYKLICFDREKKHVRLYKFHLFKYFPDMAESYLDQGFLEYKSLNTECLVEAVSQSCYSLVRKISRFSPDLIDLRVADYVKRNDFEMYKLLPVSKLDDEIILETTCEKCLEYFFRNREVGDELCERIITSESSQAFFILVKLNLLPPFVFIRNLFKTVQNVDIFEYLLYNFKWSNQDLAAYYKSGLFRTKIPMNDEIFMMYIRNLEKRLPMTCHIIFENKLLRFIAENWDKIPKFVEYYVDHKILIKLFEVGLVPRQDMYKACRSIEMIEVMLAIVPPRSDYHTYQHIQSVVARSDDIWESFFNKHKHSFDTFWLDIDTIVNYNYGIKFVGELKEFEVLLMFKLWPLQHSEKHIKGIQPEKLLISAIESGNVEKIRYVLKCKPVIDLNSILPRITLNMYEEMKREGYTYSHLDYALKIYKENPDVCSAVICDEVDIKHEEFLEECKKVDLGLYIKIASKHNLPVETCDICYTNPLNVKLIPCSHFMCKSCRSKVAICPFCRSDIISERKL